MKTRSYEASLVRDVPRKDAIYVVGGAYYGLEANMCTVEAVMVGVDLEEILEDLRIELLEEYSQSGRPPERIRTQR